MKNIVTKIKFLAGNKLIKWGVIPFLFLILWFVCSLLLNKQVSFSILEYGHHNAIISAPHGKLLKGEKVTGEFTAAENDLGIVIVRFNTYVKPDYRGEDVLLFKIKEKGAKNWYSIGNYRSGLLDHVLLFPFGFTAIPQSKNKVYDFEIDSLYGNDTNAVELSHLQPNVETAYQLPKKEIFGSKLRILHFLFIKSLTSFTNIEFLLSSTIYLVPLIVYILAMILSKSLRDKKVIVLLGIIGLILADIFLMQEYYTGVFIMLFIFWLFVIQLNKLGSRDTFIFAFVLLFVWLLLLQFGIAGFSNKLNIWTYTFLSIGVIQAVSEEVRRMKRYGKKV